MNNIEILEEFIKYFEAEATQRKYRRNISITVGEDDIEAIENLIQENKELKEYKKIAELTKISCCTAQNCEALNNAIKNGLENEKLLQENKELKEKQKEYEKQLDLDYVEENYIPKSKLKEKIEELKKEEKQELKGLKGQDRYFIKQIYQAKRIVFEEILALVVKNRELGELSKDE